MHTFMLDLYCPAIQFQLDGLMIQENLAGAPGINTVNVNLETKHVVVTTANQDGGTDIIQRLTAAGYPVVEGTRDIEHPLNPTHN